MSATRRDFIRMSCCTAAGLGIAASMDRFGLMSALAQAVDYKALVCIFLFGGNDGNNVLVPMSDAVPVGFRYTDYLTIRGLQTSGGLALPQTGGAANLLPINALTAQPAPSGLRDFGLHPALLQTQSLFQGSHAALIANMGVLYEPLTRAEYFNNTKQHPANLFSHSDQQQQWQTADPSGFGSTGWAGRVADRIQPIYNTNPGVSYPPITTVAGTSIFCTGQQTQPFAMNANSTPGLQGFPNPPDADARYIATNQLLTFDTGLSLVQATSSITARAILQSRELAAALQGANLTDTFPSSSIGRQLFQVAKIIQVRAALGLNRQVFFCSMGGFDTHTNQINDQNNLMSQLDAAMKAFYDSTVALGVDSKVTTFTMSEFGRALKPASGAGSDHGWGSHQIVVGGAVRGADVYGRMPVFALGGPEDSSSSGRWIPSTSIDQFGATLATWFGVLPADFPLVFPNLGNFASPNLGFML